MYDAVILGSGFFSWGYALSHENCIVIERTQLCDPYYYGRYNGFTQSEYSPETDTGRSLSEYLKGNGILCGEKMNVNALESALCKYVADKNQPVLLGTEVISVEEENGAFCVEIYNNGGTDKIYGRKIMDTRNQSKKTLNVLVSLDADGYKRLSGSFDVSKAFHPGEYVVAFSCTDDINDAKLSFYNYWKSSALGDGNKIISFAYLLTGDGRQCSDSFYKSTLEAFDKGVLYGG